VDGVTFRTAFSKAGVIMLTRCLAKELAPEVRVNAIGAGTITMPGDPPGWEEDFIKRAPLRRSGRPSDVAETVMFLVRSEFITGQVNCGGWRADAVDGCKERRLFPCLRKRWKTNSWMGCAEKLLRGVFYGVERPHNSGALVARTKRKAKDEETDRSNGQRIKNPASWNS